MGHHDIAAVGVKFGEADQLTVARQLEAAACRVLEQAEARAFS